MLLSIAEGCALAVLFAASHPELVRALVLITPTPRVVRGPGYEWAQSVEERDAIVAAVVEHWGSGSPEQPWGAFAGDGRASATPAGAASSAGDDARRRRGSLAMVGEIDVRDVLPACSARRWCCAERRHVLRRAPLALRRRAHPQRAVRRDARGQASGSARRAADEIERFLTGVRRPVVSDRVLATVLFTDIVGSTERAAELGDGAWRVTAGAPRRARARGGRASPRAFRQVARRRSARHDDDIGGLAVHIAARISNVAAPGEVLVSNTVRDLIVGSSWTLTERGEHDLKGVPGTWRIFAVEA